MSVGRQQAAVSSLPIPTTMRTINLIVIHCSATVEGRPFTAADIKAMHTRPKPRGNGWSDIGYHHVIELDGKVVAGRREETAGAHVAGHNAASTGVCYIGGIGANGRPKDTRTPAQVRALEVIVRQLRARYPQARIRGHRDMSPDRNGDGKITSNEWLKDCPCFDVAAWCRAVGIDPK